MSWRTCRCWAPARVVVVREAQRLRAPSEPPGRPAAAPGCWLAAGAAGQRTHLRLAHPPAQVLGEKLGAVRAVGDHRFSTFASKTRAVAADRGERGRLRLDPQAAAQMVLLAGADLLRLRNNSPGARLRRNGRAGERRGDFAGGQSLAGRRSELIDAIGDRRPDQALAALRSCWMPEPDSGFWCCSPGRSALSGRRNTWRAGLREALRRQHCPGGGARPAAAR